MVSAAVKLPKTNNFTPRAIKPPPQLKVFFGFKTWANFTLCGFCYWRSVSGWGKKRSRKIFMMRIHFLIRAVWAIVNLFLLLLLLPDNFFFSRKMKGKACSFFLILYNLLVPHTLNWDPRREAHTKKSSTKLQLEFPRLLCQNSRPFRATF